MKLQLRKAFVCLLVLGSALLLMGASTGGEAASAAITGVVPVEGGVDDGREAHHVFPRLSGHLHGGRGGVGVAGDTCGSAHGNGRIARPWPACALAGWHAAGLSLRRLEDRAPRSWCQRSMG